VVQARRGIDFLRAVAPRVAVPIHASLLAHTAVPFQLYECLAPSGTAFEPLPRGTAMQV
jgi:hypothetical protein